ncbi:peptidoglycan-associated lipoprotein Pal [Marichromatium bheemlicum]|uniref:Peptidoglycan-associated lipoprotein n=1 Tax=Marichromatium bheemlicum TaxID=365339 RepID=A0ABX1IE94_9GAMM|nr:peptidoglycan-associated lipoprotein Pal [Marichromatium bheemlicum]NKN34401.1 peptidoglycan-associated lipoprotein Pal [Marichromatium bheemlicum]
MRIHPWSLLPGVVLLVLAGCSTTPRQGVDGAAVDGVAGAPGATGAEVATAGIDEERARYAGPWEDPASPLSKRVIYFDYDNSEIRPEYVALIQTHARYLGTHPQLRVTLEGHTDERGTREYNLALSDQRADSVRRFMLAEGVQSDQVEVIGYGEERPASPGHDEAAWRLNRRVVIEY